MTDTEQSAVAMSEDESIQYQIDEWLAGRPWHNTVRDECCPDFSCCGGDIAPLEVREAFVAASNEERIQFLGSFLSAMIEKHYGGKGPNVYIAGKRDD